MPELLQAVIFGVLQRRRIRADGDRSDARLRGHEDREPRPGTFLVLSAYLCWTLWSRLGIDPLLGSLIVTVPLAALGAVVYRFIVERVQRLDHGLTIVVTFSVALVAEAVIALIWWPNPTATTPAYFNQAFTHRLAHRPARAAVRLPARGRRHRGPAHDARQNLARPRHHRSTKNPEGAGFIGVEPEEDRHLDLRHRDRDHRLRPGAGLYAGHLGIADAWIGLSISVVILGGLGSVTGAFAAGLLLGLGQSVPLDLHLGPLGRRPLPPSSSCSCC